MVSAAQVELTLAAFNKQHRMCVHMICESTGISRNDLRYVLVELQRMGKIERLPGKVTGDMVYQRVGGAAADVDEQVCSTRMLGIDERTARSRVIMLKRMKSRLIIEWHPALDLLIADYEGGLKAIDEIVDPKGVQDGEFKHVWS